MTTDFLHFYVFHASLNRNLCCEVLLSHRLRGAIVRFDDGGGGDDDDDDDELCPTIP